MNDDDRSRIQSNLDMQTLTQMQIENELRNARVGGGVRPRKPMNRRNYESKTFKWIMIVLSISYFLWKLTSR